MSDVKTMNTVVLKNKTKEGQPLQATYSPDKGMNLFSYKKGEIEIIDQSTRKDFDDRFAGLGAMIGPHFHVRKPEIIPKIEDETLFPHIARIKAEGKTDPFTHGIGRYAPWKYEATETRIDAQLSGKDLWKGVSLSSLEGQNFQMNYSVELTQESLNLTMSVVSDTDSIVGIHHYFHLPEGQGTVFANVQNTYIVKNQVTPIPESWDYDKNQKLVYPLNQDTDFTFHPYPNKREGEILLDAIKYKLLVNYQCASQENSFQLWHPKGASFVCIEPNTAQDPRHANLTVSSLQIQLKIL